MATVTEKTTTPPDVGTEKEIVTVDDAQRRPGLKGKINETLLKHSHDADAAMQAFEGLDGQVVELTEEKRKALLWKIDLHLMPVRQGFDISSAIS